MQQIAQVELKFERITTNKSTLCRDFSIQWLEDFKTSWFSFFQEEKQISNHQNKSTLSSPPCKSSLVLLLIIIHQKANYDFYVEYDEKLSRRCLFIINSMPLSVQKTQYDGWEIEWRNHWGAEENTEYILMFIQYSLKKKRNT